MNTSLITHSGLSAEAQFYIASSMSANTQRGYEADLKHWKKWCAVHGRNALDPQPIDIADYLSILASQGLKHATLHRRISAIRKALSVAALNTPTVIWVDPTRDPRVTAAMTGIARVHGIKRYKKTALEIEHLRQAVAPIGYTVRGCRDRAILCMQFAGALRGAELLALTVGDVSDLGDRMAIRIARSKTDQVGRGATIVVPATKDAACPVSAYRDWLDATRIESGPVFRRVFRNEAGIGCRPLTHHALAKVVKRRTADAGLVGDFSGHSCRRGLITSAKKRGVHDADIMGVSRHKAVGSMYGYIEIAGADQFNAIATVFGDRGQ